MEQEGLSVRFFGKSYTLPQDAITFMRFKEYLDNLLIKLSKVSVDIIKKYDDIGYTEYFKRGRDIKKITDEMNNAVQWIIDDFIDRGIYDVDATDILDRISAIDDVELTESAAVKKITDCGYKILDQRKASASRAYNAAANHIKGSGVRVYTNNFTSFMINAAIENSIVKSQAKAADRAYEGALRNINTDAEEKFEQACRSVLLYDVLSKMPDIFAEFHDEIFKIYLVELAMHDEFDIDSIEKYSDKKSSAMLENIDRVSDKEKVLRKAFEICPFNFEVYEKMLELGYFDVDTLKDAKKIFQDNRLNELIEEKINSDRSDIDKVREYAKVLAYYCGKDEKAVLISVYSGDIDKIKIRFDNISHICNDGAALGKWILKNIRSDMNRVVEIKEDEIKQSVQKYVDTAMKDSIFIQMYNWGLISVEDIRMKDSLQTTLDAVKEEYISKIVPLISDSVKEAKRRKTVYEDAYNKFNAELKEQNDALSRKKAELGNQGIFAFSVKKQLKKEIEKLEKLIQDINAAEPVELKNAFFDMY